MPEEIGAYLARIRVRLGFLLTIVYLVFCRPTPRLLAAGAVLALFGLGLRALATGYLEKERTLATAGPYTYTRNPLYLGSAIMAAGFALAGSVLWLAVLVAAYFAGIYWPVMKREEARLRLLFPEEFAAYASTVPLFFPRFGASPASSTGLRSELYWKNREYRALVGYLVAVLLLVLKMRLL